MPFAKCIAAGYVLFCVPKENQKGRRCPQGMKAPVGLLSRRPVCEANAACSARQGLSYFQRAGPMKKGLLAPSDPKAVGLHTKNPSRSARGFFVFRRFRGPSAAAAAAPRRGAGMAAAAFPSAGLPLNPLRHRCAMPPPPKGGGFALLTGRCKKAPPFGGAGCEHSEQTERVLPVGITQNGIPPVRSF